MITRDKEFHLNFWPFFATVLLQNVMVMSVNLLDNLMLGGFSEAALSGAAVVNQIQFILLSVINGAGDGLVVLCSQYWGQNRGKPIQRIASIALWLAVGLSMVLFVLVSAFPYQALRLFTPDAEIVAQGVEYLSVIKYTYPLLAISTILLAMLRSVQTVKITLAIAASSLGINAVLNYALIYGNLGAPALGAAGAAWATLVSRVVELGIILVFLMKWEKKLHVEPRLLAVPDKALSSDYLRVSLPTLIIGFQWGLNISLQTAILGHMDAPGVIAANSVAANLVMFLKVIAISAASSAGVLIGKTVGRGDIAKVKEYVKSLQWIFLAVGIFSGAGVLLLRIPLL
ncbi:MAG: MATE family efflux transporter, partial [Clostridiales bacterium]|nr:MATE family efflux transporter [Clostridiales bacterium]